MARKSAKQQPQTKLFIIDTNVLMHDPSALFRFEEHDLFIPFITLEELDKHKTGTQEINRNARTAIRMLDGLMIADGLVEAGLTKGYGLALPSDGLASGNLYLQSELIKSLEGMENKADNLFLAAAKFLEDKFPGRHVAIVSKDFNLRVKARALGIKAEDYLNDNTVEDADLLPPGFVAFEEGDPMSNPDMDWESNNRVRIPALASLAMASNEFVQFPDGSVYQLTEPDEQAPVFRPVKLHNGKGKSIWGLRPRNTEQSMALELLLDPDIDIVALLGPAGTGKTLLTLAAALEQIDDKLFNDILYTRATVSIGDEIGFLPGNEEEKMAPWLGAVEDALDVLLEARNQDRSKATAFASRAALADQIKMKSISFMRGRTFHRRVVILDEAQNLTPKQMKALITRVGPDSKLILMGNLGQIDTPYLTEASCGLAHVVERFRGWRHFGQLILSRGERSRLASFANDNL